MTERRRFPIENELLAMSEEALFQDHAPRAGWLDDDDGPMGAPYQLAAGVAVVSVCGPLLQRAVSGWWSAWDGYDAIQSRVECALADPKVSAVVIALDSPGGIATGMVDTGRAIRAVADHWKKPLVAHAGSMACSAAYGLAVAADQVLLTTDGTVGSVGVLATICDRTKANEAAGLNVVVLRSGALKADGHPDVPLTAAATSRLNARVTQLASMFAEWVGERRGMTSADVLALQGGMAYGADAVSKNLADGVGTLADAIATAAALAATTKTKGNPAMQTSAQALTLLASLREALAVTSDDEITASIATLKMRAAAVDGLQVELNDLRAQLAQRDAATAATARASVLDGHRKRGALTPAMEADADFMATLAPLAPAALDRILGKLPGMNTAPLEARRAEGVDPTGAAVNAGELTAEEREWAKTMNVSEASMLATKKADAERAAARGL